ncbi:MAG: UDP-N-acetylglucosamine 2-epimerase (non-hydrolyzing) [Candidatus Hinthialibacter antarcticus]|nr:UDP-N-acetylglucosamine 2-epimerase (non-hydrolyzing) [Candidatus Hinthialibacter antarcticus]
MTTKPLATFVLGTRPEAIKCAPVILEARQDADIDVEVAVTSQHRHLQDEVLNAFGITPDFDLDLMKERPDLTQLVANAWLGLSHRFSERKPGVVLVQGDTTTAMIAGLAAFYQKIPVAHIEAGLRTYNKSMPFPEESNRRMISAFADINFAPTRQAKDNLLNERIDPASICVVGNPGIDSLLQITQQCTRQQKQEWLKSVDASKTLILVTCHRRENWGENLEAICGALKEIVNQRNDIEILFAVHPNPIVRDAALRILGETPGVTLRDAIPYPEMATLMNAAKLILTDSGGIQEEAPVLGKPVLVMRETTERPEGVDGLVAELVGADPKRIVASALELLTNEEAYQQRAQKRSPYGDGKAAQRIWQGVRHHFGRAEPPAEFQT